MKIFLVGYMGCGKSTKAKQLAARWACPLIDLDTVIEETQGKTIAEIFAEIGESGFRQLETHILKNYHYPDTCVVACGGGLPCFFDNMKWMNQNAVTVYLKMEPAQLVSRLENREKRPLIAKMDNKQLLKFIKIKLIEREPYYLQAKLTVDAFDLDGVKLDKQLKQSGLIKT